MGHSSVFCKERESTWWYPFLFAGVLQLSNVEIQNFGSPLYSSIELTNVSAGSWIVSSTLHQSCSGGIRAAASHGIILNDNIVFGTVGHGIDLEGQNFSLSNNLVVLMTQPAWSTMWVAGIKVNQAKDVNLYGNVVAGSERLGFHVRGHRCSSPEARWSDNVAHSSLHGLHLYKENGLDNCTGISGFLAFKNFDYGAMLHVKNSVQLDNLTLVDNTIGLLAAVCVSSAPRGHTENVQILLRNSVIVATSSSFDCIQDRVKPRSANLTSTDRAPSNPRGGRVGILWPVFTSEPNRWPQEPWHRARNGHSISGIMKLQGRRFWLPSSGAPSIFIRLCIGSSIAFWNYSSKRAQYSPLPTVLLISCWLLISTMVIYNDSEWLLWKVIAFFVLKNFHSDYLSWLDDILRQVFFFLLERGENRCRNCASLKLFSRWWGSRN